MVRRRALLVGAAGAILAAPGRASARARGQGLPLAGILTGGSLSHTVFLDARRGLGYTDGQTVQIEIRFHQGNVERATSRAAALVASNPAVE